MIFWENICLHSTEMQWQFFNKIFQSCIKLIFKSMKASAQTQEGPTCWCLRMVKSHLTVQDTELCKGVIDHSLATHKIMSMVDFHTFLGNRQQRPVVTSEMFLQCLQDGVFYFAEFYTSLIPLFSVELLLSACCGKESEVKFRTCSGWNQGRHGTAMGLSTCLKLSSRPECLEVIILQ